MNRGSLRICAGISTQPYKFSRSPSTHRFIRQFTSQPATTSSTPTTRFERLSEQDRALINQKLNEFPLTGMSFSQTMIIGALKDPKIPAVVKEAMDKVNKEAGQKLIQEFGMFGMIYFATRYTINWFKAGRIDPQKNLNVKITNENKEYMDPLIQFSKSTFFYHSHTTSDKIFCLVNEDVCS